MKQFRYLTIRMQGNTAPLCMDVATGREIDVQNLFREGWKPVREIPMGATGGQQQDPAGFIMLVMERN